MIKKEDVQTVLSLVEDVIQKEDITVYRVEPRDLVGYWNRELNVSKDFPYLIVNGTPDGCRKAQYMFFYLTAVSKKCRTLVDSGIVESSKLTLELSNRVMFYVEEGLAPRCSKMKISLFRHKTHLNYPTQAFYLEKKIIGRQAFLADLQEHIARRHRIRVMRKLVN